MYLTKWPSLLSVLFGLLIWSCANNNEQTDDATNGEEKVLPVSGGPAKGILMLGGGDIVDSLIYKKFIELAGGPDAVITIIPTAMDEKLLKTGGIYALIKKPFIDAGANNVRIFHANTFDFANDAVFVTVLSNSAGVWFTGGRQWRLVDSYLDSYTHMILKKLLERGGIIGGSSAGATILGSFLVRGDTQSNEIMMGDHQTGFGFLKNAAVDQHLLRPNRRYDLIEVITAHPELLGIGIEENTVIIVNQDQFKVMGENKVAIYDIANWTDATGTEVAIDDKFFFLSDGETYDMKKREVVVH